MLNTSLRTTLFGKFYEEILKGWLESSEGFKFEEGKPRIYWNAIPIPALSQLSELTSVLRENQEREKWCTPDGLASKNGKWYAWEAKNWPLWKYVIDSLDHVLWRSAQLLATEVVYESVPRKIAGFVYNFWSQRGISESRIDELRDAIKPRELLIYYNRDIMNELIHDQPEWYKPLVESKRTEVDSFFRELLGED